MELINGIIAFFQAHFIDLLAILGAFDLVLGIVSKWTKSTWDDNLYSLVHGWVAKLGQKSPNG